MFVDRKKILYQNIGSGGTINIPLSTDFFPVDNAELIEDKFVDDEIEKAINPIIDYKKIIFEPAVISSTQWNIITKIKLNLNFYVPSTYPPPNTNTPTHRGANTFQMPGVYSDLNFILDDLFCRTNRLMFSFLRLSFFDSPYSGVNKLLFFSDIYTQIGKDQKDPYGLVLSPDICPISFVIGDPVLQPDTVHEGFHIYWFKDLVDTAPGQEYVMWMTATYNNAANGRSIALSTHKVDNPSNIQMLDLDGPDGILYLKVVLKNDGGVYKYKFEPNPLQLPPGLPNVGGVNWTGSFPSIIFYQITP
tara:strand:+ start:565 stop:1476 length:912 start_codon:yes stop_codon:yes gene_type:complete